MPQQKKKKNPKKSMKLETEKAKQHYSKEKLSCNLLFFAKTQKTDDFLCVFNFFSKLKCITCKETHNTKREAGVKSDTIINNYLK